jgi:hypothetical protein
MRGRITKVSDLNEFIDGDANQIQEPGKLRERLETMIALVKEKDQKITDLETQAALNAARAVWDDLGVPQPIRDMYRGDTAPDAIRSWWDQSRNLFNVQVAEATPAETPEEKARREQLASVQDAAALGSDHNAGTGLDGFHRKAMDLSRKSDRFTQADLDELYRSANIPKGFERVTRA